ncbi:MAG: hypothetical protein ACK4UR_05035 [Caldimicrobium sp.]
MLEALKKVKEELGEDAVIIDSGKVVEEGREFYEIVAALDEVEVKYNTPIKEKGYSERRLSLYEDIRRDILEIKEYLREIFSIQRGQPFFNKLIKEGVPEEVAQKIVNSTLELPNFIKEEIHKKGVSPISKVQVFIGEPGAGKTTSVFKIAFWYKLKKNVKILVLNVDNYKIGGKEQAQKLSQFLEIPYLQCDWEDFKKYYSQIKDAYELVFVDTPSLGKKFSIEELREIYKTYPFLRFNWVVRATEYYKNLLITWEEIKELPIDGLILTFMDRVYQGTRLFWLLKEEIPLPIFASIGERIPEDLKKLDEKALMEIFLRGLNNIL